MKIKGKDYKISNILFIVFIFFFVISFLDFKPDKKLEIYQQELIEKEDWLVSELDSIANFMNFEISDHRKFNREVWYTSRYASPEYNANKLQKLYHHLIEKGWVDMTDAIDKNEYISNTSSQSQAADKYVRILCHKKATIFMYMTDMQNDYKIDLFKARTLIELKYDYSLPCYNLE